MKTYIYKVYDSTGTTLKTTWNDVITEPAFSQELNNGATEMTVTLARPYNNFGEGLDIAFTNRVKVYVVDKEAPTGSLLFTGSIVDYKQIIKGTDEYLDVTLFGYGSELVQYIIETSDPDPAIEHVIGETFTSTPSDFVSFGKTTEAALSFVPNEVITGIAAIELYGVAVDSKISAGIFTDSGGVPGTQVGSFSGAPIDGKTYGLVNLGGGVEQVAAVGAVGTDPTTNISLTKFTFTSPGAITADGARPFWVVLKAPTATATNTYGFHITSGSDIRYGTATSTNSGTTWTADSGNNTSSHVTTLMRIYNSSPLTTVPFDSYDPSAILSGVIDDYRGRGGTVNYNGTIDSTGSTVSYIFNTNTTLEGIKKSLELAPVGWYWYVDPATNLIHFHNISSSTTHRFVLGRDFTSLEFDKRSEGIINTIYFTGGSGLYVKYTDDTSIATYGAKLLNYSDQRVTLRATADTIAATILGNNSQPEIRISAEIIDSNIQAGGYNIELIHVGDLVTFRGMDNGTSATWDIAQWDVDFWDFDIRHINTLILQITRIEYLAKSIRIFCSTIPPDVSKRIEDINRNLNASITVDNPSAYVV